MISPETEKKLQEAGWSYNHSTSLEELLDWLHAQHVHVELYNRPFVGDWGCNWQAKGRDRQYRFSSSQSEAVALAVLDVLASEKAESVTIEQMSGLIDHWSTLDD